MQLFARNVVKVELDSTSATVARNVVRKVTLCVRALMQIWQSKTCLPFSFVILHVQIPGGVLP